MDLLKNLECQKKNGTKRTKTNNINNGEVLQ